MDNLIGKHGKMVLFCDEFMVWTILEAFKFLEKIMDLDFGSICLVDGTVFFFTFPK